MKSRFRKITNIILTLCLLFTFSLSNSAPVSAELSKQDISINVQSDSEAFFDFIAENKQANASYSVRIIEKGSKYLWESRIEVDEKTVSETTFIINKIENHYNDEDLQTHLSNVILGTEDSAVLDEYLNDVFDVASDSYKKDENARKTRVLPAVVPLAIGAISGTTLASLEAALFATVAAGTATVATAILKERQRTSDAKAEVRTKEKALEKWDDFTGIPKDVKTSATRHVELAGVNEIANRIKRDRNNDGDLEIYISSKSPRNQVLLVYDINSTLKTTVNRHLGNHLNGRKITDASYRNERLDLKGYTVFLIYDYDDQELFHVHFVPQADRSAELHYMRYCGNFDLQIFPRIRSNPSYSEFLQKTERDRLEFEKKYKQAIKGRNLLKDSKGNRSVVPYK